MGVAVLVLGNSGTGKSTSLRNFKKGEVGVINVASKPLPFKNDLECFNTCNYEEIKAVLKSPHKRAYVIDDAGYLMQFENLRRVKETGYQKFTDFAIHFASLFTTIQQAPADLIVYIMAHMQTNEDASKSIKTIGKMLDNQLCVEGLVTICLIAEHTEDGYWFYTNDYINTPAKSPMGMFKDAKVENDLKMVDSTIREYYSIEPLATAKPAPAPKKESENGK